MKRLLISLLAGLAAAGCAGGAADCRTDVLVIGGTTSGTTAAIASARMGVRTLIVEQTPMLGGMLTAQGVCATDGNFNLPSGLWNEFREKLRQRYGGIGALWTGWVSTTLFEPHVADSIFKAMAAAEPQLEVRYGYRLTGILRRSDRVTGAEFTDSTGHRLRVRARVTIDATDLGDALPLSGSAYRLGMDARRDTGEELAPDAANDVVQDLTVVAILKDYGPGSDRTIPCPEGYDPAEFEGCYDLPGVESAERMLEYGRMPNHKYMINWPKAGNDINLNVVELPFAEREAALEAARQKTLRFVYHIQHTLGYRHLGPADDEFDTPDRLAYLPYHREGRRAKGVVLMTLDDITQRYDRPTQLYRTGISVGDYPVDHHRNCRTDVEKIHFPPVPSFSIPLGALIPERIENLVVADKAISVSNLANGSTRLQPVVMLTGQAAGTLAALSVTGGCTPREVAVRDVQRALLEQKAYIAPLYDVTPDDSDFALLQRIAATGILRMTGEPYFWANRSWFYPEREITVAEFTQGLHDYAPAVALSADSTLLTAGRAAELLRAAGGTTVQIAPSDAERPLTRRETARLVERSLDPFSRPVDHTGAFIKP